MQPGIDAARVTWLQYRRASASHRLATATMCGNLAPQLRDSLLEWSLRQAVRSRESGRTAPQAELSASWHDHDKAAGACVGKSQSETGERGGNGGRFAKGSQVLAPRSDCKTVRHGAGLPRT